MFPTFQGSPAGEPAGVPAAATIEDQPGGDLETPLVAHAPTEGAPTPTARPATAPLAARALAERAPTVTAYTCVTGDGAPSSTAADVFASLAADAMLGAQVARVRLGLDARLQKARDSRLVAHLGLRSALTPASRAPPAAHVVVGADATGSAAQGSSGPTRGDEATLELETLIQGFRDSYEHMDTVIIALEDYQRHRQGLADAGHRLGLAFQEAGQRLADRRGESLVACGSSYQKAAARRLEACEAEELRVLSKLRAHHIKAAADCRRAVRGYEASSQELRVLQRARAEAQDAKRLAGDSLLTPAVEGRAERMQSAATQCCSVASEVARSKLSMFEAKHAIDFVATVGLHIRNVTEEERGVAAHYAGIDDAIDGILQNMPAAELRGM